MNLKIDKIEKFVPKPDLRFNEFLHIKAAFNQYDYEHSSRPFAMGVFAHFGIVLIGKILQRMKKL